MTTIVTAYFQLEKSKSDHNTYLEWMTNMLIIQSPMVIFCDKNSVTKIEEIRNYESIHYPTKIIIIEFTDFYTYKYIEIFKQQYETKDHEKLHNVYLYLIWNEKSHFLKKAIEINPFSTEKFLWVDIGCFRQPNRWFIHWPNSDKIPKDKMLLLSVYPFTKQEYGSGNLETLFDFQHTYGRIGGTIFGGTIDSILRWHEQYYELMEYFITIDRFIGKDQNIMNSIAVLYKDTVELITTDPSVNDRWFYLQNYLESS